MITYKSDTQRICCEYWVKRGWKIQMTRYLGLEYPMVIPPPKSDYKNVKIIDACGYDQFIGFAFDLL